MAEEQPFGDEGTDELDLSLEEVEVVGSMPPPPPGSANVAPPAPGAAASVALSADARELCEQIESELGEKKQPDKLRAARLRYELGRLYEGALGEPSRAAEEYQKAIALAPDHVPAIRGARRVLGSLDQQTDALRLFDAEIRQTRDPKARARLLYEKGQLLEATLGVGARAREAYAEAHQLDGSDVSVLEAIERCDRHREAWADLAATYDQLANAVAEDPTHRAAVIAERARLYETRLDRPAEAAQLYRTALDVDPSCPGVLAALVRLARGQKMWRELADALERWAARSTDPAAQATALAEVAKIARGPLGDTDKAIGALERAVALAPDDRAELRALAGLYRDAGKIDRLAATLADLADGASKDEQLALYTELGRIAEDALGDEAQARAWLERAVTLSPAHAPAVAALAALHERRGDWEALALVLAREAHATLDEPRRADLHARVGAILADRLDRPDEAEAELGKALGIAPEQDDAFRALERSFASRQKWRELAELYERRVDRAPDDAHRAAWLFRVAQLYEDHLGDAKAAAHAYRRVAEAPADVTVAAVLGQQRAAEAGAMWDELVSALELEAARATPAQKAALGVRIARVLDSRLAATDAAVDRLTEVVAADPKYVPGLRALAELFERHGRWDELLDTEEKILAVAPREEHASRLHRMASIARARMGRDELAAKLLRRALDVDPTHEPAMRDLQEALRAQGDLRGLAALLEQRLEGEGPAIDHAHLAVMLAEIREELSDRDGALAAYEKALSYVPLLRTALDGRARLLADASAWPRLAQALHEEAEDATDPNAARDARVREGEVLAHRICDLDAALRCYERVLADDPKNVRALLALEELAQRMKDDARLARVLESKARVVTSPGARAAALQKLARARLAAGDRAGADRAYRELLEVRRDDSEAIATLHRDAKQRNDTSTLVMLESRLASTFGGDPRVAAHHQARVAELLEATEDALPAWRAALALDPESLSATRGFTRAARRARDAAALREAARREAKTTQNQDLAVELLVRASEIRRKTNDLDEAAADLSEALELAPSNPDVAADLERVMALRNRVGELIERLSRAADNARPAEAAAALHVRVAQLHADRRGDLPAAIAAIDRAIKLAPRYFEALSLLATYRERAGHWKDAASALMNLALRATDEHLQVDAHLRLGILAEEKLNDPMRARKSFEEVLTHAPDHRLAIGRLVRLNQRQGRLDEALALAKKLVEASEKPNERVEALVELGRIERSRRNGAEAATALLEALAIQGPAGSAAEVYRALVAEQPQHATWGAYAGALEKHLAHAERTGRALAPTYLEIARVRDELGEGDKALTFLRDAVSKLPRDTAISVGFARALRKAGKAEEAAREIERALHVDVRAPAAWRELAEARRASGDTSEAALALVPLRILDAATPEELMTLRSLPVRPASAPSGLLGDAGFREIQVDGAAESPAAALLGAAAEALARAYPFDLSRYGVGKRDRIAARAEHPLRTVADRVATILGVSDFDIYLHSSPGQEVRVELGSTPALMLPAWAMQLSQPELVYLLAVSLAHVSRETHALLRIPEAEVPLALAAAARTSAAAFGSVYGSEFDLDNMARLISKGVPRRDRHRLQETGARYAASAPKDPGAWARAMHLTCARAALLVCDDLAAALAIVQRTTGDTLGGDNLASHLARFWVSDPARRFRRVARRPA